MRSRYPIVRGPGNTFRHDPFSVGDPRLCQTRNRFREVIIRKNTEFPGNYGHSLTGIIEVIFSSIWMAECYKEQG
jgi:hypothetical protein